MTDMKELPGVAPAALIAEAAVACMRTTAELHSRLATGWFEMMTHGMAQPTAVAAWSMEAMRLTAETTLRNIEHCQACAKRAAGESK